jgi:hypothetical protein
MKPIVRFAILLTAATTLLAGCSGISTYRAEKGGAVRGVRVYPAKVYLFVGDKTSKLVSLPDYENAYDVKPWAFLAKHDFNIKMADGLVTEMDVKLDSTASLALIQKAADLAAAAARGIATAVSEEDLAGTFGLAPGVYTFDSSGSLKLVSK